jgi:hypothetical protein
MSARGGQWGWGWAVPAAWARSGPARSRSPARGATVGGGDADRPSGGPQNEKGLMKLPAQDRRPHRCGCPGQGLPGAARFRRETAARGLLDLLGKKMQRAVVRIVSFHIYLVYYPPLPIISSRFDSGARVWYTGGSVTPPPRNFLGGRDSRGNQSNGSASLTRKIGEKRGGRNDEAHG